jgi:hypothetical protein
MVFCLSERHWFRNVVTKNELATFLVGNIYLNIYSKSMRFYKLRIFSNNRQHYSENIPISHFLSLSKREPASP